MVIIPSTSAHLHSHVSRNRPLPVSVLRCFAVADLNSWEFIAGIIWDLWMLVRTGFMDGMLFGPSLAKWRLLSFVLFWSIPVFYMCEECGQSSFGILWGNEFCQKNPQKEPNTDAATHSQNKKTRNTGLTKNWSTDIFQKMVCTIVIHYVKLSHMGYPKHPQSQWIPQNPLLDATSVPSLGSGSWRKLGGSPAQYILRWFSININIYIFLYYYMLHILSSNH